MKGYQYLLWIATIIGVIIINIISLECVMTVESAIGFFLALLTWVIIPGPAIFAIISHSLAAGFKSALKLITGILIGDLFYMTLALAGLGAIGKLFGNVFFIVKIAGATYMIFLGIKLWMKDSKSSYSASADENPAGYKNFLTGISITLGNPKAILFHLGFLPTFFDLTAISMLDSFFIILIFMSVLGSALVAYAYTASRAGFFFKGQRKIRLIHRTAGTMLIGTGITLAVKE
ncbi:LysE family translocator [Sediminispirochaeta smaragdinae]|uniref:Lysine exporter protein (LYSE/YGGA) n=1 Tax=Sediminispirochaeta smaragdinae (strain DSM 11293 / JCM 15392 / SEBR 4228) TaxID=573413 RepID=E1R4N7_SEDSS|nr:LysE family translocator [Sediminispirochaeta smaragdinae]ADK82125.1 Lysine exporter protein (LYSE/YGGA) [Sediminispirochaeta smaragdinae DSM 11293]